MLVFSSGIHSIKSLGVQFRCVHSFSKTAGLIAATLFASRREAVCDGMPAFWRKPTGLMIPRAASIALRLYFSIVVCLSCALKFLF